MQAAGRRTMPRLAVGVSPSASFYAPAVPRGLRLCGGGFGGGMPCCFRRAPQGALVFHSLRQFFPDVHIDSFAPHRPPARGYGGGAVFSRRERTIAHGHARTARFGGASGHSRGRICPAPRRGFATLCPLAPPMVGGLGGATATFGGRSRPCRHSHPSRQPTCRLLGLRARRPRRRRPPPCRQCRHLPPLDARAPPPAASATPSGGGLRTFPRPRPADSSGCGVSHGASSGRLGSVARCLPFAWERAWRRSTA